MRRGAVFSVGSRGGQACGIRRRRCASLTSIFRERQHTRRRAIHPMRAGQPLHSPLITLPTPPHEIPYASVSAYPALPLRHRRANAPWKENGRPGTAGDTWHPSQLRAGQSGCSYRSARLQCRCQPAIPWACQRRSNWLAIGRQDSILPHPVLVPSERSPLLQSKDLRSDVSTYTRVLKAGGRAGPVICPPTWLGFRTPAAFSP